MPTGTRLKHPGHNASKPVLDKVVAWDVWVCDGKGLDGLQTGMLPKNDLVTYLYFQSSEIDS